MAPPLDLSFIPADDGNPIGLVQAHLCRDFEELNQYIHLGLWKGGFGHYLSQLPACDPWPIAYLSNIEIDASLRNRGLGARALSAFHARAKDAGAKLALLRVGWNEPQYEHRLAAWYRRNGYRELQHAETGPTFPLLYLPLRALSLHEGI